METAFGIVVVIIALLAEELPYTLYCCSLIWHIDKIYDLAIGT